MVQPIKPGKDLAEQVGVAAGALKDDEVVFPVNFIDEQPIGTYMPFLAAFPGANEVVVFKLWG